MIEISSLDNQLVKQAVKLRRSGPRRKDSLIIVEGRTECAAAIQAGFKPKAIFFCRELAVFDPDNNWPADNLYMTSRSVFQKISRRDRPDGICLLAKPRIFSLADLKLSQQPLCVVLDRLEKPGNLGAILRTADAAGADAVLAADPQTDFFNPNVIRASLGAVFTQPAAAADPTVLAAWLKDRQIRILAADPGAAKSYTEIDWRLPSAIVIGAEHAGLSPIWRTMAEETIRIPMRGRVDSLNASVSLAVVIFEAARQRSWLKSI